MWHGIARSSTCNYVATREIDGWSYDPKKIANKGGATLYDDNGLEVGVGLGFKLWPGDVLELLKGNDLFPPEACVFWNDGPDAPPVPEGSDVPWRDIDRTALNVSRWKMGQFDYLDQVKERVSDVDEDQLSLMGLWACNMNSRATVNGTLQKFARLSNIQADFLITAAYKDMCPENSS